tara:strand:- start:3586 stop:5187 length:1602 start_codon:yes stop_codon:yes gene_type:complete
MAITHATIVVNQFGGMSMLDFLLSGEMVRFWLHYYLTIPATALSLVLALLVYNRSGKGTLGLVSKGVSITSVAATVPLTFQQIGLNMAISNIESVAYCSIFGTIVAFSIGIPFLFAKNVTEITKQRNDQNLDLKEIYKDFDGIEKIAENLEKKPDAAKIAGVDNLREENPYGSGAESKKVKSERNEPESPAFYTDNGSSIKTIGRSTDNDLVIDKDPKVSRHHARLIKNENGYVLEDTGSLNGITINGIKIQSENIDSTSKIKIGDTELIGSTLLGNNSNSDYQSHKADQPISVDSKAQVNKSYRTSVKANSPHTSNSWVTIKNGKKQGEHCQIINKFTRIGRSSDNEIELPDRKVSRTHAIIKKIKEKVAIFDVGSSTGTFVNGEKLSGVRIYGDVGVLKIGETELALVPFESEEPDDEYGITDGTDTGELDSASTLVVVKKGLGSGDSFKLSEGLNYVGRGDSNDINLRDPMVSRQHCVIVKKDNVYEVFELGSTSGTFVNDRSVRGVFLKNGDLIAMGKTEMIFTHVNLG